MSSTSKMSVFRGFSLIEMSVVITIIGITLAGAIDLATRKTESDKVTETNARMDAIEQALLVFVINNQRLPCPADATTAQSSAGVEGAPSAAGGIGVCSITNYAAAGNAYIGMVPTKTLNLADKYMADDWDRRFTYVVDARFANNLTTNPLCDGSTTANHSICFKQTAAGGITINDSTHTARSSEAIYVLISHGKNGSGAWKYAGSATRLTASGDADEQDNAGNDKGAFDAVFVQKDNTTTFDDLVRYKTKSLVISGVNGVTDTATCSASFDAATLNTANISTDPCPSATSTANCYAMAAQANNLCLQP